MNSHNVTTDAARAHRWSHYCNRPVRASFAILGNPPRVCLAGVGSVVQSLKWNLQVALCRYIDEATL
jgi:hypothetical protein